jgi:hypothetical protein
MMAKGSSKVQEQEKLARKKTCKARLKKDAHNPPQHDKSLGFNSDVVLSRFTIIHVCIATSEWKKVVGVQRSLTRLIFS